MDDAPDSNGVNHLPFSRWLELRNRCPDKIADVKAEVKLWGIGPIQAIDIAANLEPMEDFGVPLLSRNEKWTSLRLRYTLANGKPVTTLWSSAGRFQYFRWFVASVNEAGWAGSAQRTQGIF